MLCEKSGNNNTLVRNKINTLLKECFPMYDNGKLVSLIIDFISSSKNFKSVAECLKIIAYSTEKEGLRYISDAQIRTISKFVEHSDSSVRKCSVLVLD